MGQGTAAVVVNLGMQTVWIQRSLHSRRQQAGGEGSREVPENS